MKNLIRGHIYQLKKDNFFFGCLALSCVSLFVSIRLSLSLAFADAPVMGIEELFNTFLGGDIALYIFMLLTANMVAEAYRSGVMKTGDWEETLLSLHRSYDICRICIGHADGQHRCRYTCRQQIWHGDHFLSWLLCSFRCCAHSFCDGAHQLCAYRNDLHQKCNYRRYYRPCDSQYPENSGDGSGIFENSN